MARRKSNQDQVTETPVTNEVDLVNETPTVLTELPTENTVTNNPTEVTDEVVSQPDEVVTELPTEVTSSESQSQVVTIIVTNNNNFEVGGIQIPTNWNETFNEEELLIVSVLPNSTLRVKLPIKSDVSKWMNYFRNSFLTIVGKVVE